MKPLLVLRNLKIDGTELWFKAPLPGMLIIVDILPEAANYSMATISINDAIDEYVKMVPAEGWELAHYDSHHPIAKQIALRLQIIYKKKLEA